MLLLLRFALGLTGPVLPLSIHPLPLQEAPAPTLEAEADGWRARIEEGLAAAEYRAVLRGERLQAPNRAHGLRTTFEPSGIRVEERRPGPEAGLLRLALHGIGRPDGSRPLEPVPPGEVMADGARVEIVRTGLVEWFENTPRGLEHGLDLAERPAGDGQLVIELALEGAAAELLAGAVRLRTSRGRSLRYGSLHVFDASGAPVSARLEVAGEDEIRIVVDDSAAVYPLLVDPLLTSEPDSQLESDVPDNGNHDSALFGGTVANAGDVNGDGYDDVVVGAYGVDNGLFDEGAAYVFLGGPNGIVGTDPSTANAVILGDDAGGELGNQVSGAGDVNGDGYDDVLIAAHHYSSTIENGTLEVNGAVFLYLGSPAGITGTGPGDADTAIFGNQLDSRLGHAVASAGDVNGDGYDDIVIGVPLQGTPFPPPIPPNQGSGNGGAALIFHGGPGGIASGSFEDADRILLPYPPGEPVASLGQVGADVAPGGDVNGDGYDDVLVGSGSGILIFHGSPNGVTATYTGEADTFITATASVTLAAYVASAGDVNGDGFDDLLLSDPGYPTGITNLGMGALLLFLGSEDGIVASTAEDAHQLIPGNHPVQLLGWRFSSAGDVDGDGFDDVVVGALKYPGSLDVEGAAYVFRGGPSGLQGSTLADAFVRIVSGQSGAALKGNKEGYEVASGDFDGDGLSDLLIGAGFFDAGELDEGAVFAYHGAPIPPGGLNRPPVPVAGPDQTLIDVDNSGEETFLVDGTASFDPDGTLTSYEWVEGETLLGSTPILSKSLPVFGAGSHVVSLVVTDDGGLDRGDTLFLRVNPVPTQTVFFDGTFTNGLSGWTASGDVTLGSNSFPTPPQARLGAAGASLSRTLTLPAGATGIALRFWGKAEGFAPGDELHVRASRDGGPFTTFLTLTTAASNGQYVFHGGMGSDSNSSWYPATASSVTFEFLSAMQAGLYSVDDVRLEALLAPPVNLAPVALAGPDQVVVDGNGDGSELVQLDGSASFDPDGTTVSWSWTCNGVPFATVASPSLTLPVGTHSIVLVVTDSQGAAAADEVEVEVRASTPAGPRRSNPGPRPRTSRP